MPTTSDYDRRPTYPFPRVLLGFLHIFPNKKPLSSGFLEGLEGVLRQPLRYHHKCVSPTFNLDDGFVRQRSKVYDEVEGRVLFSPDVEADFFVEFIVRIKTTDDAEFGW